MRVFKIISLTILIFWFSDCKKEVQRADAFGNFEASATIVSAESNGKLLFLKIEEGQNLEEGALVALIDTTQLHLQKMQLLATLGTLPQKTKDASPDIAVLENQKRNVLREIERLKKLLKDKAATPKQLDDLNGELAVINQRIEAAKSVAQIANRGILSEQEPLKAQLAIIEEKIRNCYVKNPVSGIVLTKLAEPAEIVGFGTPLYKIANLDFMELRAYVSGLQVQNIQIGQNVKALIDASENEYHKYPGVITWIAENAEFTPKTIQTKEERVNLVYAFKVRVQNDGKLKIGMPAEVVFNNATNVNRKEKEADGSH